MVFIMFSSSRKKEQFRSAFLLFNFAISLLFLNIPLILDEQRFIVESEMACAIISIFVHFGLLSSVAWMTAEAVNIYLAVIHVSRQNLRHFLLSKF